ncbi:MAG: type II secretion system secretin GspD [Gallionella sp.]|nr:type II secretion system secretin GspD [Gallionella sp.]
MKKYKLHYSGTLSGSFLSSAWRSCSAAIILLFASATLQQALAQNSGTEEISTAGQSAVNGASGTAPTPATGQTAISNSINVSNRNMAANRDAGANKGTLNFVDADIESVIAAVGDYTGTTFIIDPRVKGTLTLVSEKPLTKSQALQLLGSVLRLRGYTIVSGSGYSKVVPEAEAKLQAGPIQAKAGRRVRGDQIATEVFRLNFESAANLVSVLRPLISPNNTINANPASNTLVITDYADNLVRLGRIIAALDGPENRELEVVPIRYAVATDIAVMVNRLLETSGTPAANAISVLAYPRTNSVVVRAPSAARADLAKALIKKLDQPTAQPGNVHVVYLKNAEATKLAQTLRAVVSSDTSVTNAGSAPPSVPPSHTLAKAVLSSGGSAGFIQADPTTNTLIITASEPVYRDLRNVIDKLDARRAQVYIESLIVEVSATKAAELGVQWAGLSGDANTTTRVGALTGFSSGGNNLISQAAANAAGSILPPGNGLTLGVFNKTGLGALAHALESDSSANILSMPNLITLDNEEAKIIVGQNVPFITGQYTTAASAGSSTVNPFQTVERQDIGLTLRVKPQISEGGTVKMAIYQETSGIDTSVNTAGAGLATTKRSLDTNVLVDDGQIIVLGGLIDDNMQESVEKVPLLGSIPIIGGLFRYKTKKHVKTNLMVFLRPTIIRTNEQSVDLAADRYDYIRSSEIAGKGSPQFSGEGPQLPPLQDGRMVGGPLYKQAEPVAPANTPQTPSQKPDAQQSPAAAPQ